jgi:hypothetical protein
LKGDGEMKDEKKRKLTTEFGTPVDNDLNG